MGRRFKTKDYKDFEEAMLGEFDKKTGIQVSKGLLPDPEEIQLDLPEKGRLYLQIEFGIADRFDWDNGIKPFQDLLQKKYGFNDTRVHKAIVTKSIVKRGGEYIKWSIEPLDEN